ncbi:MAG: hypothetical protein ACUVTR_01960 [Dehalococcoidia bacterium]
MVKVIGDVGAPALVTVVDILTLDQKPEWNEWASYIMAGAGYIIGGLDLIRGTGGEFIKNIGIAALPLAARNIYNRVKAPVSRPVGASASRFVLRHTPSAPSTPVSRSYQPEFESTSPHAF